MKIAYITTGNPFHKNSWSGTDYYVRKALEDQGCIVYCIYGYKYYNLKIILRKIWAKLLKKIYQGNRNIYTSNKWAHDIIANLEENTDAILSLSTIPVASLKTNIPIYIYIDGIYEYMLKQGFRNVLNNTQKAHQIEDYAIQNCTKIITSSFASAEIIKNKYQSSEGKVEIVPLGANLDIYPSYEEIIQNINRKTLEICKILFVGVSWERKGAQLVINTIKMLHEQGFPIELHLVGIKKIPIELEPYIINHGFINKMEPNEFKILNTLYKECHFLFVPSYAEAYGLVFCEASAYGMPSISHAIGGIPTIIKNNINGRLFENGTQPEVFAKYIKETFNNKDEYKKLSLNSFTRFQEELNWKSSSKKLIKIMSQKENIK